jgi:hypothetical protein
MKHRQLCDEWHVPDLLRDRREPLPLVINIGESLIAGSIGHAHDLLSDPRFKSIVQRNYEPSPVLDEPQAVPADRYPFIVISLPRAGICQMGAVMTRKLLGATPENPLCVAGIGSVPNRVYVFWSSMDKVLLRAPNEYPGILRTNSYTVLSDTGAVIESRRDYRLYVSGIKLLLLYLPGHDSSGQHCPGVVDINNSFSLFRQSSGVKND